MCRFFLLIHAENQQQIKGFGVWSGGALMRTWHGINREQSTYVCTYIHTYIHLYTCTNTYKALLNKIHMQYIRTYVCMYIHTYIRTLVHIRTRHYWIRYVCSIRSHIKLIHTRTHAHTHTRTHTHTLTLTHTHTHAHTHIHTHTHTHTRARVYNISWLQIIQQGLTHPTKVVWSDWDWSVTSKIFTVLSEEHVARILP